MQATGDARAATPRRRSASARRSAVLRAVDLTSWMVGFTMAAWTRYEFNLRLAILIDVLAAALVAGALQIGLERLHGRRWGRLVVGSLLDARARTATVACTAAVMLLALVAMPERPIPASTPPVGAAVALVLMLTARWTYRHREDLSRRPRSESAMPVLLFGMGSAGQALLRAMLSDPNGKYLPVGLLDDDPEKNRLRIDGVPVLGGRDNISTAVAHTGARTLILSVANADAELIREIQSRSSAAGAEFKVVPPVRELVDHRIKVTDVRSPDLDDLLGRRQVVADLVTNDTGLRGRRILVTGAGGSIGSELCRQIVQADPAEIMMLDRDESALHSLQLSLCGRAMLDGPELILADIRDSEAISRVVADRRPEIVFHAAALKHLTLLQRHPGEAIKTNIWGTLAVLDACRDVAKFVNISTDKAANPISVLGYSKRITERLTADAAQAYGGTFLSVRFGNVLNSRGSVVTAFRRQIEEGLPITVTHPQVTRYLMTVQEAVHLVLQATAIGRDGEALVLDMGQPVRIDDIARQLAAQTMSSNQIVYTGLRPGEKLHEDLLGHGEVDVRPLHPLISHVIVPALEPGEVTTIDPFAESEKVIEQMSRFCQNEPAESMMH